MTLLLERREARKGINRYIMECKFCSRMTWRSLLFHELIDTLWNVNVKIGDVIVPNVAGINRYIMECKCI